MPIHYIPGAALRYVDRSRIEIQNVLAFSCHLRWLQSTHQHKYFQGAIHRAIVVHTMPLEVPTIKNLADSLPRAFSSHHHMVSAYYKTPQSLILWRVWHTGYGLSRRF